MRIRYNKIIEKIEPHKIALEIRHTPHDAGFFSVFNGFMNHLTYLNKYDIISPDWRMTGIKGRDFNYYENRINNVWDFYFEPIKMDKNKNFIYKKIKRFGAWSNNYFFNNYHGARTKCSKMWSDFICNQVLKNQDWREKVNKAFTKHIKIKKHINNKIINFYKKHMFNENCIGVHVRNKYHKSEQPNRTMPTHKDYFKTIKDNSDYKNSVIFLATDNNVAKKDFKKEFKNNLIYQDNIDRTEKETYKQLHRYRSPSRKLGEDVISDCVLLSKCKKLIHVVSNVAIAAMYMNPNMNNHCLVC